MKIVIAILIAFLLAACGDAKPSAELTYVRSQQERTGFIIEFDSDQSVENLFPKTRLQNVVRKFLKCALGDDQNFDLRHRMRYVFEGGVEPLGSNVVNGKAIYHYISRGDFYENPPDSNDLDLLRGPGLIKVLGEKHSVPCKIVLTIYASDPYYSNAMLVPVAEIVNASISKQPDGSR